ncbi:unnamed protein product [Prorocentrum cordatum]|uniref:Uncharacterized protein n=1 Tax=Prorocentrum cordatum TaxID=2364126 RepID=A0ABN9UEC1_9DINO|nr:unnamed protein product [Polarella glacialis]
MEPVLRSAQVLARALAHFSELLGSGGNAEQLAAAGVDVAVVRERADQLAAALADQFDRPANVYARLRAPQRTVAELQAELSKVRRWWQYALKKKDQAQSALVAERQSKEGNQMRALWIIRCFLSPPTLSQRALADYLGAFPVGGDRAPVGQGFIGRVRDAFAATLKDFQKHELNALCAAALDAREAAGQQGPCVVYLVHVHDEAQMRLRSFQTDANATPGMPLPRGVGVGGDAFSRSREAKVQNNVIRVATGDACLQWLTELQPLARKTADTLAAALFQAVKDILEIVGGQCAGRSPVHSYRLVHLLIGDGVNTNAAAGARLLELLPAQMAACGKYLLLLLRCASHQSNLCVEVAITGKKLAKPLEQCPLTANCSRLFKYLLAAHVDEYCSSLRIFVAARLRFIRVPAALWAAGPLALDGAESAFLRLYGADVFPDEYCRHFPSGVRSWDYVCEEGEDAAAIRAAVYAAILRVTLKVEERPVVTRFWLFGECVFSLVRLKVLGVGGDLFEADARAEARLRVQRFVAWWRRPETDREVRQAALCVRLTLFATKLTAKKDSSADERPAVVRLQTGVVQERTSDVLQDIFRHLHADPVLDIPVVVDRLLLTEMHICIRFGQYSDWPYRMCTMVAAWNPLGFQDAIKSFLDAEETALDAGYGVPVQREALAKGSRSAAIDHLRGSHMQEELFGLFSKLVANSLEVERSHALGKRSETTRGRLRSVGFASRNHIIETHLRGSRQARSRTFYLRRRLRQLKHTSVWSKAWEDCPELAPRPVGRRFGAPASADAARPVRPWDRRRLHAYVEENTESLQRRVQEDRARAKELEKQIATVVPHSAEDWLRWFSVEENEATFRERMDAGRAEFSRRIDGPPLRAAPRVHPQATSIRDFPAWAKKLAHAEDGFYLLKWGPGRVLLLLVASIGYQVGCVEFARDGHNSFTLDVGRRLSDVIAPLTRFVADLALPEATTVHGVTVDAAQVDWPDLRVSITKPVLISMPDRAAVQRKVAALEKADKIGSDPDDEDAESVATDLEESAEECTEEAGPDEGDAPKGAGREADGDSSGPEAAPGDERKKPGTNTVQDQSCLYFTMTRNPAFVDIVYSYHSLWRKPDELGRLNYSKRLRPRRYGGGELGVRRVFIALRAWGLWRTSRGGGGWKERRSCRRKWWQSEVEALRRDLASLGGVDALGPAAGDVRDWAPEIL